MKKVILSLHILLIPVSIEAQIYSISPIGYWGINKEQMKESQIKAFEITSEYYSIGLNHQPKKNKEISKITLPLTHLVNDNGIVYAEQNGPKKDSMIFITHQPFSKNSSIWIAASDSLSFDSSFIYLYNKGFDDKQLRMTHKYDHSGHLLYFASYLGNPSKRISESHFYYTVNRLDSIHQSPGSMFSDELKVFVHDNSTGHVKQTITYSIYNDFAGIPISRRLSSVSTYVYAKGNGDGFNGLLKQVITLYPITDGIVCYQLHKIKWYYK